MALVTLFRAKKTRALMGLAYAAPLVVLLALLVGEKRASIDFQKSDELLATLDLPLTHTDVDRTERAAAARRAAEFAGERLWPLVASELDDMLEARITALSRHIERRGSVTYPSLPQATCV